MKRRTSLKALAAISVGTLAIGYWAKELEVIQDLLSRSFFKPSEQDLISSIADTIIPKSDQKYGALDLGVPIYLLAYFEKCEPEEVQLNVKLQLQNLESKAKTELGKKFKDCSQVERELMLLSLENAENEQAVDFVKLIKRHTLIGFNTTEEIMTEYYDYQVIPGEFFGCAEIPSEKII